MITNSEIQQLRDALNKCGVTSPLRSVGRNKSTEVINFEVVSDLIAPVAYISDAGLAELIVLSHNLLPALLDSLEEMERERDEYKLTYELMSDASRRAVAEWRKQDPEGRKLMLPDLKEHIVWAFHEMAKMRELIPDPLPKEWADCAHHWTNPSADGRNECLKCGMPSEQAPTLRELVNFRKYEEGLNKWSRRAEQAERQMEKMREALTYLAKVAEAGKSIGFSEEACGDIARVARAALSEAEAK